MARWYLQYILVLTVWMGRVWGREGRQRVWGWVHTSDSMLGPSDVIQPPSPSCLEFPNCHPHFTEEETEAQKLRGQDGAWIWMQLCDFNAHDTQAFLKAGSILKLLKGMSYLLFCKSNCPSALSSLMGKCKDPGYRFVLTGPEPWVCEA